MLTKSLNSIEEMWNALTKDKKVGFVNPSLRGIVCL